MTTFMISPEAYKALTGWIASVRDAAIAAHEQRLSRPIQQRVMDATQSNIDAELMTLYEQYDHIKPVKRYCPPKSQKHSGVLGARRAKERGRRQHNARMRKGGRR